MRKISVYIISLLAILHCSGLAAQKPAAAEPPDTVMIPLAVSALIDISGPVVYFADKKIFNAEGFISTDLNEKRSLFAGGGFCSYKYSQYNYSYATKGIFLKAGIDFNLLKPQIASGKYWAGVGLHYGVSIFSYEIPELSHSNYWGTTSMSIPSQSHLGHFLEASGGFRSQLLGNFRIGWSVSLRKMIYAGGNKDVRPIYIPGYGLSSKSFTTGINYFLIWNFKYKSIRVLIKKEAPEEPEENATPENNEGTGNSQELQNIQAR